MRYKALILSILVGGFCTLFAGQNAVAQAHSSLNTKELLNEREIRATAAKAIELIQHKDYGGFRDITAAEVSKNFSDQQIILVVDKINELLQINGVPFGDHIQPGLAADISKGDTVYRNFIQYEFEDTDQIRNHSKVLIFNFLKQFGASKLAGIQIRPMSGGAEKIAFKISPIQQLDFDAEKVSHLQIYYDEGNPRKTVFKNDTGRFAISVDTPIFSSSGLKARFATIFKDLKKTPIEKQEPFTNRLNRGKNPSFMQVQFDIENKDYSVLIYLPIMNGGVYDDYLIVQQRQAANIGYQYYLKKSNCKRAVKELMGIISNNNYSALYLDIP